MYVGDCIRVKIESDGCQWEAGVEDSIREI